MLPAPVGIGYCPRECHMLQVKPAQRSTTAPPSCLSGNERTSTAVLICFRFGRISPSRVVCPGAVTNAQGICPAQSVVCEDNSASLMADASVQDHRGSAIMQRPHPLLSDTRLPCRRAPPFAWTAVPGTFLRERSLPQPACAVHGEHKSRPLPKSETSPHHSSHKFAYCSNTCSANTPSQHLGSLSPSSTHTYMYRKVYGTSI